MPTLCRTLEQVSEGVGNALGLVADHAHQTEEVVHEALGRALTALAYQGPAACAQQLGARTAQAAAETSAWLTALPDRRIAELLPLPPVVCALLPPHTLATLLQAVPGATAQAAAALRDGAASAEEAVHEALGRALTALAYQGPAACAQQVGNSLEEVSRWAGGSLARLPASAQQALFDAVPLPRWCTRVVLRWAASYAAASFYRTACQAGQTATAITGELSAEAVRIMGVVERELRRFAIPVAGGAAPDALAGTAGGLQLTGEQRRQAELRAFRATLLGMGLDEVQDLISELASSSDPLDIPRLATARQFLTLQWAAAAGGSEPYLDSLEPERARLLEQFGRLRQKQLKTTPSRVLPLAVLPARYRDKHLREKDEFGAARARLEEIEATRATVLHSEEEITGLRAVIAHVQGPNANNLENLKPYELAACERQLQEAVAAAEGYADTACLRSLLDRVRREPDARSMLNVVRARGVVALYASREEMGRLVAIYETERAKYTPNWLERAGLCAHDPDRAALLDRLTEQLKEAQAMAVEYAALLSLYQSPEYTQRTARAEARLKTFRDHDFHQLLSKEYEEAADRVVAAAGNSSVLLECAGTLLEWARGARPDGLRRAHTAILEGMAEQLPHLVAAAGPFYAERVDFAFLLQAVEKELARRRTDPAAPS
ncbi:hypothetical protein [Streptomyces sp. BA2]|uniref:hypothetical protein n=1 Tax=Streptomyces sp. BA2 TaxID=436595 RepID=UPI001326881A|nr:hypothetical protein [Streptomyces sp. BA2]MWA07854.1 hypothetical protein [Streptomyces sp. BA2]